MSFNNGQSLQLLSSPFKAADSFLMGQEESPGQLEIKAGHKTHTCTVQQSSSDRLIN